MTFLPPFLSGSSRPGPVWCRVLICGLLLLCLPVQAGYAAGPGPAISSAAEADYPPFCVVNEKQQADGFSVELLRETLQVMGRKVSFKVGSWAAVKQSLIDKQVQVLPLVGRTPEREALFDFTFPYMSMHGTLLVRSDRHDIQSLADLRGKQVAVMAGDNAEEFLRREQLPLSIVTTKTFDDALRNLARGDYDAVVIQKLVATQLINKLQLTNLKTVGPPLAGFVQSFCFAVGKGDAQLLSVLNEGLSLVIANGTFEALRKKWFAAFESVPKSRILVGGDYNYPPYEFLDENGQPAGYNVDLTRAIAAHLGLAVDIQLGPWAEIRRKLENHELDLIQGMFYSAERDKTLGFSNAHTLVSHVVVTRRDTDPVGNLAQLAGKIIVVMSGDIMHDLAVKAGYERQLVLAETQQEALHLVAGGDVDYALLARVPALYWINKEQLLNLQVGQQELVPSEYCYAGSHANQALVDRFDLGLTDLKADGEYREIHQQWLGIYEDQGISQRVIKKYALLGAIPLVCLICGSVLWTRMLKRKVQERTADLLLEIAERKRVEAQLAEQAERLKASQSMLIQQEKLAAIGQLAAGVAHEINNPLGYISSNLNALRKYGRKIIDYFNSLDEALDELPPEGRQLLKAQKKLFKIDGLLEDLPDLLAEAFDGIDRIKKIVQGMKSFARADSDTPSAVDINQCLENAVTIVWNEIKYNSTLERDLGVLPSINGFPQQLAQVFMNLLVNASHAIHEKGLIQLESRLEGARVVVRVHDNGAGIATANLAKIFDPFFTTKAPGKGTGLGMSIAREIIQKHGGTIEVESEVGKGTLFTVSLPVGDAQLAS